MTVELDRDYARFVSPQVLDREWGQEIVFVSKDRYAGKVLLMKAGTKGGYQFHVAKTECFHLFQGEAFVEFETLRHGVVGHPMHAGQSVYVPAGARHRVTAVTDCVFFEVGDPSHDDRVHAEREIGEQPTGGLPDTWTTDDGRTFRRA